ncbi:MAG: low molecular weight protein-tyrosine-phosphatase [Acidimicrobiales bacterium]
MRIAMVCLGNICRSPMAESVARAMVAEAGLDDVIVESFGTADYHCGEGADPQADAALCRGGWPYGRHVARQITTEDVEAADLVLCADHANLRRVRRIVPADTGKIRLLRDFDPDAAPGDDEVPDPWGRGDAAFDRSLLLVEKACRGLVGQLATARR